MTLVHFPSNISTSCGNEEEAERFYEKEGALLQRCAALRDRIEQLGLSWNRIVPSDAKAELSSLQEEIKRLPAASTQVVQVVANALEEGVSRLRFRQAFPIVSELDRDSLIPNAADQLPEKTLKRMERTVAAAKRLFERGNPRAIALMNALEKAIL